LDDDISTKTPAQSVPAIVCSLIAGALATFDTDRNASKQYLLRASAILQACAPLEARKSSGMPSRGGLAQWQLHRVVDYIEERLAERITREDLAGLINVSTGQLSKAFKVSVGIPPIQYIVSRKIECACSLLRTTRKPVSHIAFATGFCDQAHFCRVFKRVLGISPAAWRRANGADPKPGQPDPCVFVREPSHSAPEGGVTQWI
jgi:transcriptional regulator GlxA family with amidase domain